MPSMCAIPAMPRWWAGSSAAPTTPSRSGRRPPERRQKAPMARLRQRLLLASLLSVLWLAAAQAAEPIRIGFSMALTGGLAGTRKAALLATQMWAEDVNAARGLLRRPVQLGYYYC